jgi:DeoR/GlpR family transcriptional regulator of sugar metabolism
MRKGDPVGGAAPAPTKLRHELIRAELARSGGVRIRDLVHRFGVSRATVRRDLYVLIDAGEAVNAHGGALLPSAQANEPQTPDQEAVAVSAARTVAQNEVIGLFGGALIRALARQLSHRVDLRIVTNSLPVAHILEVPEPGLGPQVTLLSGVLHPSGAVSGSLAAKSLRGVRLDASYFDCVGFDARTGATVDDVNEAALRRASMQNSRRSVLLVERESLGARGLRSFGAPTDFDTLVAGSGTVIDETL